jgi:hypothetical protein
MAKWSTMLLAGGKAGSGVLLAPGTTEELFTPQAMVTAEAFYPTARLTKPKWKTYGLGWFQQDYRGRAVDYHTGSIDGMVAIHGLLRDERAGVVVLANLDHAELRHAIMLDVFDRYIGGARRDWSSDLQGLYDGLRREGDDAIARSVGLHRHLLRPAPRRRGHHSGGRPAPRPLRQCLRRPARALALRLLPSQVGCRVARDRHAHVRPRRRWQAHRAGSDGRQVHKTPEVVQSSKFKVQNQAHSNFEL